MTEGVDYQFEADPVAAERLDRMSNVFTPTMSAIVDGLPEREWAVVLDLGCGPGSSTRSLAQLLHPQRIVGIDASEEHLARARRLDLPGTEFEPGDVLGMDLARYRPDLIYARFLLAYIQDVPAAIEKWRSQLTPGGLLALEESLGHQSVEPTFQSYFDLFQDVMRIQEKCFFGGRKLLDLPRQGVLLARDQRLTVAAEIAAEMFLGNLPLWEEEARIRAEWEPERLDELREGLEHIRRNGGENPAVWTIRQVVLEASPTT